MRGIVLSIAIVMACTLAIAEPTAVEIAAEIADNVAVEYAECSAYFSITSDALASSKKSDAAQKYDEISNKAAVFSLEAAKQNRNEAMATKVTLARVEISLKDMRETIDNNYSNLSLLSSKYMKPCLDAMQDSAPLVKRWTQKIQNKYEETSQSRAASRAQ